MSHSYDELLRQVTALKSENCKLRQELQDNSSHLTKLENEASNMKDVLTHLHDSMQDDLDLDRDECDLTTSLDHNSNDERNSDPGVVRIPSKPAVDNRMNASTGQKSQNNSPGGSPSKRRSQDKEIYTYMDDLNRERNSILQDIEQENKHRKRYFEQLDTLTKKLENLQLTEEYDLQMDMSRRQLEYEAQRLQERMQNEIGAAEQIQRRHEARLQRIRAIETEMLRLQQKHREQDQSDRKRQSSGSAADRSKMSDACTETEPLPPSSQECDSSSPNSLPTIYHGAWPIENVQMRHSVPGPYNQETSSVMSFNSSNGSLNSRGNKPVHHQQQQQLGTKVEMVYSLLSMLGTHDKDDMSRTLLAMSSSQDSCVAMRQSGCLPLLIQLLHGNDKDSGLLGNTRGSKPARARAAAALHNIVHSHPDDKRGRREARVLRLLEQIRAHCDKLREPDSDEEDNDGDGKRSRPGSAASKSADIDHHPGPAIAALMKLSFDEEHRHAICTLGGLQAIAELLQVDTDSHGNTTEQYNVTMRRYACMALTNLTFGDGTNKALLCSMKMCLRAIVLQLLSPNEDLCQVAASVLRNLSWRADLASKKMLREVDTVSVLMEAALAVKKESTLKSILSALWNLSAHCSENKADICAVPGALAFLVSTLTYKSPSKTLAIIENGGGILRNVSSHIAIREDYRDVLRNHSCLQMLLKHLRSPSLTIVSNACGTLWNLSARCSEDQTALWELGAVSMLRNLVHSKHKMISMGSAAALKNLLAAKPNISLDGDKPKIGLHVRKQKALEAELDQNLAETCENLESPQPSPVEVRKTESQRYTFNGETSGVYQVADSERHSRPVMRPFFYRNTLSGDNSPVVENKFRSPVRSVSRSGSQDSVGSVHSDISHDRTRVNSMLARSSKLLQSASFERRRDGTYQRFNHGDSLERKPSRIERIMQEVAIHAGIDGAPSAFSAPGGGDNTLNNAKQNHAGDNKNLSVEKYSNLHQKMENLNLNDSESNEEQPLNFSMKYAPAEPTVPNNQNNRVPVSGGNPRPIPKIGNYVGGPVTGKPPYGLSPHGSPMMQRSYERKECNIKNVHGNAVPKFSGYRETDIDTMDEQPTNYSLQFSEQDEPTRNLEEPINYSVRYREPPSSCADCKIQSRHVHSSRSFEDQNDLYGDTVKTFYTEGTPLNYMSTATSISDLSAKPNGSESRPDERLEEVNEDSQIPAEDEVKNFSTRYPESEKLSGSGSQQTGSTVVSTTNNSEKNVQGMNKEVGQVNQIKPEERDVSSGPLYTYDDSAMHSPRDKPVTYGVEGTPTCFSRVSSLSSLHTNEGEEANDNKPSVNSVAQERSYTPPIVPGDKMPPTDVGYDRDQKTVTFDENNHVQETPLMFSRCSSLGSLSSCEAHSIHSSIPSEYSTRRTSEVVSPSDLPDSPSETMPPSPKRKEAPVKFDNIRDNKMPVKVAVPKPVATVPQKQLAPSAGTPKKVPAPAVVLAGMFRETPVSYAVEDSPVNYSHASSLSALTIDDEPKISKDLTMKYQTKAESPAPKASVPIPEEQENSSLSEGDEDMLIECINSGMPASSKKKMKRSQSDNVIKKKSSSSQSKLNQISRGSRLPSRINNKPGFGSAPTNFAPKPVGISSTPPRSSMPKIVSPRSTGMSPHAHLGHAPHSRTPPPPARAHQPSPTHKSQSLPRGVSSGLPRPSSASKLSHSSSANSMRRTSSGNPAHLYSNNDDYAQDSIKKFSSTELPYTRHSPRHEEYAHDSVKKYSPIELPTRIRQSPPQHDDYAEDSVKKFSTAEIPRVQQSPRNVPRPASQRPNFYNHDDFLLQDTVKTFATEGTPLNFSTATSLSDLSAIVDDNKYEPPAETNNATDRKPSVAAAPLPKESGKENAVSDTSSMSDGEDLLSEIIQSAMPKKVTSTKRRSAEGAENKEVKVVAAPPVDKKPVPAAVVSAWQFQPQRTSSMNSRPSLTQEDQVKTYMTEGTPINFSTATSLSDLTVDDSLDVGTKLTLPISKPLNNVQNSANNAATYRSAHDDSVFVQSHSYDSPRVYAVEGTPFSISRQDSLSSLSCDEEGGVEKVKPLSKKVTPNTDYKPSGFTPPKTFSPTKKPENQTVAHLAGHHRKQAESPNQVTTHATVDYSEHKNMDEQPKNFAVEGTPMCFSRNSSLSSLNSDEHEAMATSNISTNERSQMEQKDQRAKFKEEGTPVTFSRNSSLSSLSIISMESMSYDPTPTEQALLDQCISSAMPKKVTPTKPPNSMIGKPAKSGSFSGDRSKLLSVQRPQPSSKPSALKQVKYQSPENSSPKRTTDGTVKMNLLQRTASPRGTPKKESEIKTEVVSDCSLRPYPVVAVAANVQADNLPSQDTNGNAHLEVWRKAPHKSFDETISKNVEGEGRFGWRRAHSQDSDAFLKQRKDSTNHAKIQEKLASPEEKLEWRKTYTVPTEKAFLNNTEVVDKPDTFAVDNRVLDQHLKSPDSCEKGVLETGREKPPSPETERMNAVSASEDSARSEASEISTESALTMQDLMPRVVNDFDLMDSDYEVGDITQETLPVLSGFTSMETSVSSMGRSMHSMTKSGELLDQPSHAVQTPAKENHVDGYTTPEMSEDKDDLGLGMSPEEVQALEEAANMVVTSIKRDMSCSTLDDDMFIDNETLSLVSTEYASDTGSELSLTMSSSSKASDHFSELSSSSAVVRRGPRILKPGEKSTLTAKSEEESARGIRGKRKGLYSVKSVTKPANKPKETPPKVAPRAVVAKPVVKPGTPKTNTGSMATPGSKKPVARTTVTGNAVKTPPKTQPKPVAKKASPPSDTTKTTPPALGSRSNTVIRKTPVEKPAVRPKPPTKQGTFVKEAATSQNTPIIDVDQNGNRTSDDSSCEGDQTKPGRSSPPGGRQKPGLKKANNGTPQKQAPQTWSKALGGFNFVVDTSQDDCNKPEQSMQRQKSATQIGSTGARRTGNASPRSAANKTSANRTGSVTGSGSALNKTGSGSSLNKAGSGSSLNKSGSAGTRTALTKGSSASNLKKAGSKTSLKQSDSNASLKKSGSRSSTPTGRDTPPSDSGRRSSTDSSPGKKTSTAGIVGKKQVNSKIAGLWKKDDGAQSPVGKTGSTAGRAASPQTTGKKAPGSPNTSRRSSTPTRGVRAPMRSGSPASRPPPAPPVRKSSLSSNSSTSSIGGTTSSKSSASDGKKTTTEKKKPETLSRGKTFDKISRPSTPNKNNSPVKASANSWRKGKASAAKNQAGSPEVWVKRDSSTDSLSRTADSVSSLASASSEASLTLLNDRLSDSNTSVLAENNSTVNAKLKKEESIKSSINSTTKTKPVPKSGTKPSTPPKPLNSKLPNGQVKTEQKPTESQKTVRSPPLSPTLNQSRKIQPNDNRNNAEPLSAIVQPFNYNPNQVKNNSNQEVALKNAVNTSSQPESPKPMTKTEMLLARRRQSCKKPEEPKPAEDDEAKKAGCLVTTV